MTDSPVKQKVLIVDDTPENIYILMETLKDEYAIVAATNGEKALQLANAEPIPDIILLDIMMPGMDGYEVCARLKANDKTKDLPVIFITAKTEEKDEIKGFSLGAVDYITKPISPPKVKARVKIHLALKNAREMLETQNEELIEAAKLKEDVDGIMRHDLKSPLNSIISLPQIILEDKGLEPEHAKSLKMIEDAGFRMLNMINLSLDLFKMERGVYPLQPVSVDILKIIKKIVSEAEGQARTKNITFNIINRGNNIAGEDFFRILGEELLCYSILSNLIKNAMEASPEGQTVSITLDDKESGSISVHNRGVVPEEIRDQFFEKYVTSGKSGGTGLGTYSAKLIAETQGGHIKLDTSEEDGTTITLFLPLDQTPSRKDPVFQNENRTVAQSKEDEEPQLEFLTPMRVLIVDDDAFNIRILEKFLNDPNIVTDSSENGKVALTKLGRAKYDLVLMDMEMPVMDGVTAMREIRKSELENRNIPVIALSAHDEPESRQKCLEAGFTDYLTKPVDKKRLLNTLLRCFDKETDHKIFKSPQSMEEEEKTDTKQHGEDIEDKYLVEVDEDLRDLIPDFLDNKRIDLESMQDALENKDFDGLRKMGHKLKGSFHMYGFNYISNICHEMEEAAKEKDDRVIENNLKVIKDYLSNMVIKYGSSPD
ncbi:response regulator [Thermodesulfobacteriota bacterium]